MHIFDNIDFWISTLIDSDMTDDKQKIEVAHPAFHHTENFKLRAFDMDILFRRWVVSKQPDKLAYTSKEIRLFGLKKNPPLSFRFDHEDFSFSMLTQLPLYQIGYLASGQFEFNYDLASMPAKPLISSWKPKTEFADESLMRLVLSRTP